MTTTEFSGQNNCKFQGGYSVNVDAFKKVLSNVTAKAGSIHVTSQNP